MAVIRLFRHRSFALLWFAGLISVTGDWLLRVALPIYVFQLTGSPATTSAVVAVDVGTALAISAVSGALVDRWDRRRVILVANLLQAALILPLVLVHSSGAVWIVLLVIGAQSALSQFSGPAEQALLPRLLPAADLAAANSLNALNMNIARLVGPALGAVVAATMGLSGATVLDAASFLVAAALVLFVRGAHKATSLAPISPVPTHQTALGRWGRELTAGIRAVQGSVVLRALLVIIAVTSVGEGIMASLFAVFVHRGLGGGAAEIGWLMSAQAVGGILGGFAGVWLAGRIRPIPMAVAGLLAFGLVDLVIFNLPRWTSALGPELVLFAVVGVPGVLLGAALMTLLQTEVDDARRGRVFTVVAAAEAGGALLGSLAAGSLTDVFGVVNILTVQGAGYVLAAWVFAALVRRPERTSLMGVDTSNAARALSSRRDVFVEWWPGSVMDIRVLAPLVVAPGRQSRGSNEYRVWHKLEYRELHRQPAEYAWSATAR